MSHAWYTESTNELGIYGFFHVKDDNGAPSLSQFGVSCGVVGPNGFRMNIPNTILDIYIHAIGYL